ncbi:MAG: fimbrillin family protein [Prevotellaceae bacterium]|jgi:hypothetical protein|nr:fimbrillin family protein [Prevotellaceae bacterium]
MKKSIFFAALVAAVMTACSNEETLEQQNVESQSSAISFRTVANNGTRATIMDSQNIKDFQVSAVYSDYTNGAATGATLMDNVVVVRNLASSDLTVDDFTYEPTKYFPVDGEAVDFYAFSPAGSRNLASATITNDLVAASNYTTTGTSKMDLVYTVPLTDPSSEGTTLSQEDFLVASNLQNNGKTSNDVLMTFDHALSKVTFAAKNVAPNTTVNISAIKLMNLGNSATLTLGYTRGETIVKSLSWAEPAARTSAYAASVPATGFTLVGANDAEYSSLTTVNEGLMVLPQTLQLFADGATFDDATDPYVEITYSMNDASGLSLYPAGTKARFPLSALSVGDAPFYNETSNPTNKLLCGHSYNLQFTFGAAGSGNEGAGAVNEIKFSVSVETWNGTDHPIE